MLKKILSVFTTIAIAATMTISYAASSAITLNGGTDFSCISDTFGEVGIFDSTLGLTSSATFDVAEAGLYKLTYVATPGDGSDEWVSSYDIKLNDATVTTPTPGSAYDAANSIYNNDAGVVYLRSGSNTISFTVTSQNHDGEYLMYLGDVVFTPTTDYSVVKNGTEFSNLIDSDCGFGMYCDEDIVTIKANINVAVAGTYKLSYIASPGDGSSEDFSSYDVKVNDTKITSEAASVYDEDYSLNNYTAGEVTLNKGNNTVEFLLTGKTPSEYYVIYVNSVKLSFANATGYNYTLVDYGELQQSDERVGMFYKVKANAVDESLTLDLGECAFTITDLGDFDVTTSITYTIQGAKALGDIPTNIVLKSADGTAYKAK